MTTQRKIYYYHENRNTRSYELFFAYDDIEWEFEKCNFETEKATFTLEDWKFLSKIYIKINIALEDLNNNR